MLDQLEIDAKLADEDFIKDNNKVIQELLRIQSTLGYPDANQLRSVNDINACSQQTMYFKWLGFMSWLVELADFIHQISPEEDDIEVEKFVMELAKSDRPRDMMESKQFFNCSSELYKDFLATGDEGKIDQKLCVLFGVWQTKSE